MRKMSLLIGGAVGYVLGARAGREQYDKIMGMAKQAKENPKVQDATEKVASRGSDMLNEAKDKAGDLGGTVAEKSPDWVPGSKTTTDGGSATPATMATSGSPTNGKTGK